MDPIPRIQLDLSQADKYDATTDSIVTADSLLQEVLRRNDLDTGEFLFTVIDGMLLCNFLSRGTYRSDDIIYAFRKEELKFISDDPADPNCLDMHFAQYDKSAIAVYKLPHFVQTFDLEYRFLDPNKKQEALEAIIQVTW